MHLGSEKLSHGLTTLLDKHILDPLILEARSPFYGLGSDQIIDIVSQCSPEIIMVPRATARNAGVLLFEQHRSHDSIFVPLKRSCIILMESKSLPSSGVLRENVRSSISQAALIKSFRYAYSLYSGEFVGLTGFTTRAMQALSEETSSGQTGDYSLRLKALREASSSWARRHMALMWLRARGLTDSCAKRRQTTKSLE